uniref:TfoX N-terminal domain-containing protein n=1 Tax=Caulobacter sp. (strain K31) TaxID=366602 RepID=B0T9A1_CAUSK
MTADEFRQLALAIPNTRCVTRLGAIEFQIQDATFAALGAPDPTLATLRLAPDTQAKALAADPHTFAPQAGGAGARGVTCVRLARARPETLAPFLAAAASKARNRRSNLTTLGRR